MKPVTRKRYTAEFKAQAVGLVGLGKPVQEVAEDLGIGTSILYGWVRKGSQPGHLGSGGLRVPQARDEQPAADELPRLRRENANLRLFDRHCSGQNERLTRFTLRGRQRWQVTIGRGMLLLAE